MHAAFAGNVVRSLPDIVTVLPAIISTSSSRQESAIAVETNSELSRVLDELDIAAGDNPTTTTTFLRPGVQE